MRVILSAMGRTFLRAGIPAFFVLASGFWAAPNLAQARSIAAAASIAFVLAGARAIRVFVPQLATGLAKALGIPAAYGEVVVQSFTVMLFGFIALVEGVLSAPDLQAARAAGLAAILTAAEALFHVVEKWLTPESQPAVGDGVPTPPQPK